MDYKEKELFDHLIKDIEKYINSPEMTKNLQKLIKIEKKEEEIKKGLERLEIRIQEQNRYLKLFILAILGTVVFAASLDYVPDYIRRKKEKDRIRNYIERTAEECGISVEEYVSYTGFKGKDIADIYNSGFLNMRPEQVPLLVKDGFTLERFNQILERIHREKGNRYVAHDFAALCENKEIKWDWEEYKKWEQAGYSVDFTIKGKSSGLSLEEAVELDKLGCSLGVFYDVYSSVVDETLSKKRMIELARQGKLEELLGRQ